MTAAHGNCRKRFARSGKPEYLGLRPELMSQLKQNDRAGRACHKWTKEGSRKQLEAAWLKLLTETYLRY